MPKKSPAKNKLPEIIKASDFEIDVGNILVAEGPYIFEGYRNNPHLKQQIYTIVHNLSFKRNLGVPIIQFLKNNHYTDNQIKKYLSFNPKTISETKEYLDFQDNLAEKIRSNGYMPGIIVGKVYSLFPDIQLTPKDNDFPLFFSLKLKQYNLHEIDDYLQYHFTNNFSSDIKKFKRFLELCLRQHKLLIQNDTSETVTDWIVENNSSVNTVISSPPPISSPPLKAKDSKIFVTPFKWKGTIAQRLALCKEMQSDDVKLIDEIGIHEFSMIFSANPLPFKEIEQRIAWIDIYIRTNKSNLKSLFRFLYFLKELGLLSDDDFITKSHTNNLYSKIEYFFEDVYGRQFENIKGANPFLKLTGDEIKNYQYPDSFYKIKDKLSPS